MKKYFLVEEALDDWKTEGWVFGYAKVRCGDRDVFYVCIDFEESYERFEHAWEQLLETLGHHVDYGLVPPEGFERMKAEVQAIG